MCGICQQISDKWCKSFFSKISQYVGNGQYQKKSKQVGDLEHF